MRLFKRKQPDVPSVVVDQLIDAVFASDDATAVSILGAYPQLVDMRVLPSFMASNPYERPQPLLYWAAAAPESMADKFDWFAELLLRHGAPVNSAAPQSRLTALHLAAGRGRIRLIDILLDHGANIEVADNAGFTPLCSVKSIKVAQCLLARGANVNAAGGLPLWLAAADGNADLVRLYLSHGAHTRYRDRHNGTAREMAQQRGYAEVVRALDGHAASY
jgi:ankyrin repeat protein